MPSILEFNPADYEKKKTGALSTPPPPDEGMAGLEGFGRALAAPIKLAGAAAGAVTGLYPQVAAEMVQGQVQQSLGSLKESVDPNLSTVERLGSLIGAIPGIGPATQSFGRGLGAPLASALVEGKVPTAQEKAQQAGAVGEGFGNLLLAGASGAGAKIGAPGLPQAASKISTSLATSRAASAVKAAEKAATLEHEAINRSIGMKEKFVPGPGVPVDPAMVVKAQGIKTGEGVPTRLVYKQLDSRLEDLTALKQQQLESHPPIALDQAQVDRISKLLERPLRKLDRIARKKSDPDPDLRETVRDIRITLKDPANIPAVDLDAVMHNMWEAQKNYLAGKKVQFLANRVKQAYGELNSNFGPEIKESNVNIRGIDAAKDSTMLKMRQEIADQGVAPTPPKSALEYAKDYAVPVALGGGGIYVLRKLINDMFDKAIERE